jgi:acetyltransferase-like isoleucine patch superfamily enzyme
MANWKLLLINTLEFGLRILRQIFARPAELITRAYRLSELRTVSKGHIPASTQFDGPVNLVGTGQITLGEYCRLGRGVTLETSGGGKIVIGNCVRINAGSVISAHIKIEIGDDSLIGEYVSIRDANHGTQRNELIRLQELDASPVFVGKDVWIGRGSCVLKGITISNGAVIGANSVVVRDVDEGDIVAGIPARLIKKRKWS